MFKLIYSLLFLACLVACENGNTLTIPVDQPVTEISAKLDTNLVVPVNDDRITWQKPFEVIKMLGELEGESVADIGAGSGFFAFRLALKADKVIALDIDPNKIELMDTVALKLTKSIQNKLETRMAGIDDSNLKEDEVDNIIIINTIAFIDNRKQYIQKLKKGLRKGGLLMIVDYKMKRLSINGPEVSDRVPHHEIENLMLDAGYDIITSDDTTLEYQYIVVGRY